MGDQSGNITVSASGADQQATMDAVVKQLLEETPHSALQQHLNAIATEGGGSGGTVVELVLNGENCEDEVHDQIMVEQQESTSDTAS